MEIYLTTITGNTLCLAGKPLAESAEDTLMAHVGTDDEPGTPISASTVSIAFKLSRNQKGRA